MSTEARSLETPFSPAINIETVKRHHDRDSGLFFPSQHTGVERNEDELNIRVRQLNERYAKEKHMRMRPEGTQQYVPASSLGKSKHFVEDPWTETDPPVNGLVLGEHDHHKIVIVGAGLGGLLFAVRLLQEGFNTDDFLIIDAAGGFGGTWYWNRYPGLMCDTEAYIYLPLLEETGYMPTHKYASGNEIRDHANRIATKWQLNQRSLFRTKVRKMEWHQNEGHWQLDMTQTMKDGSRVAVKLEADFVIIASGVLDQPKVSDLKGVENYQGQTFHTARWDYSVTGGSPYDPSLTELKDKKVGIIGTGATAVQAIPDLAKWSKELYVFQRTAASVDIRDQRPTDESWWVNEVKGKQNWQRERSRNFIDFNLNVDPLPDVNMVNDGWTTFPSFASLIGTNRTVNMDEVPAYVSDMQKLDLIRSERVRARTDEIVENKEVADSLKAWYYGWCKRPTFHDDYLPTFNLPHVKLIDTKGKGIDDIGKNGIIANGHMYPLDLIIFSTGFDFPTGVSPVRRAGITAIGRNGKLLDEKWSGGITTLHGIMTRDFPNLFFSGFSQGAASINLTSALDVIAQHTSYIISTAMKTLGEHVKCSIEPTEIAEENWANSIAIGATARAAGAGCTPSYYNAEGLVFRMTPEMQAKAARAGTWPYGLNKFQDFLDDWHRKGDLSELEIQPIEPITNG